MNTLQKKYTFYTVPAIRDLDRVEDTRRRPLQEAEIDDLTQVYHYLI